MYKNVKSLLNEIEKAGLEETDDLNIDRRFNIIGKNIKTGNSPIKGSETTLTNNETKYIIKVIKSFESRGILLKGTT